MSTVAAKKPPVTGREGTASPTSSPGRLPPRASTPSSAAAGGVTRTRSLRSGTPVTARAAAQSRRESPLSNSNASGNSPAAGASSGAGAVGNSSAASVEAEEAARAEALAVIDDLKDRLAKAEGSSDANKRQVDVLQSRLDEALAEQARLEEKVHEQEELIEALRNEQRESARQIREMESIYEAERSRMVKEKEDMANREEEMQAVIQRLKDSLAQRVNGDDEGRPSRQSNNSPSVEGGFAPPASLQRSDSRNNSKLVLQKDKLIESLRLELAEAQIKLVESENQGGGRLHEVERLLMETRMANARLLEDNESYQLLLHERTLNGDFTKSDFSYMGTATNQDALNALEGRTSSGGAAPNTSGAGASLADELSEAHDTETTNNQRRLESELRSVKDQNKALTLYINNLIERLLQHQDFESILDQSSDLKPVNKNKELPPPPPASGPSLLQRALSIAPGVGGTKPRPRPMSFAPSPNPSTHTNPETAPSIPIGLTRNTSVRRGGRPMSEQFTGGSHAASVVNQMYRGEAGSGPLSPTLRASQTFFSSASSAGARTPSGGHPHHHVPMSTSGNFPGMRSETSSTSGDSVHGGGGASGGGAASDVTTPPSQSPPRMAHGGGGVEKSTMTFPGGNKPRPLRLVQENPDVKGAETNKRASWFGWAMGGKKDEQAPTLTGEALRE